MYKIQNKVRLIGEVKNGFKKLSNSYKIEKTESIIVIRSEFVENLFQIEDNDYLEVVFLFIFLRDIILQNNDKGEIFSSHNPKRLRSTGTTTVELLEKRGSILRVRGLDVIDGTPIIDIKPHLVENV